MDLRGEKTRELERLYGIKFSHNLNLDEAGFLSVFLTVINVVNLIINIQSIPYNERHDLCSKINPTYEVNNQHVNGSF